MKAGEMSELEFCVKNISYPLGMLLEDMEIRKSREDAKEVRVEGRTVEVPEVPFITECYLVARALFESLTEGNREKLKEDATGLEEFREKILSSSLREKLREGYTVKPARGLAVNWEELEERKRRLEDYITKLERILTESESRDEVLVRTGFLRELSVDDCLLLQYLLKDRKMKELANAAMGKHNPEFRRAVMRYFRRMKE